MGMGIGQPPTGFISVGARRYADFARRMGLLPLGTHLEVQDKVIGWRTNKRFYVDPDVYRVLFGKRASTSHVASGN